MLARRAEINVIYKGIDITADVKKDLLSFTYTDNASGNADDTSITLKDEKAKWLKDWSPQKGDAVKAEILTTNWRNDGDKQQLPCGTFIVDEPSYSGRPRVISINAISTPANSNFSTTKRSKAWENIRLKAIAQDIANRAGLGLFFDSSENPLFTRIEQTEASDMSFLSDICTKKGLAFKVTDNKIVIFNEAEYEKKNIVATFYEGSSTVLGYTLKSTLTDTAYTGCKVKYYDANIGKLIEYLYTVSEVEVGKEKILVLNSKVSTGEEAKTVAQKALREKNKKEYPISLQVVGNIELLGGSCIALKDFGVFDGKYYIEKAVHSLPSYSVQMDLHKVLEGY